MARDDTYLYLYRPINDKDSSRLFRTGPESPLPRASRRYDYCLEQLRLRFYRSLSPTIPSDRINPPRLVACVNVMRLSICIYICMYNICICAYVYNTLHPIETRRSITSPRFFPIFFYSHLRNSWISSRVNFCTSNSGHVCSATDHE